MIRRTLLAGAFALSVLTPIPLASAQDAQGSAQQTSQQTQQDELLSIYEEAFAALDASVKALPQDSAVSAEQLERAQLGLTALAEDAPTAFVGGLSDTFARARDAIRNRSQVDLAVQAAVLKGGFHRLVYEAALRDAATGDVARAQRRLAQLATDMGLPAEAQSTLREVGTRRALQAAFEAGVAETIGARLETTQDVAQSDANFAYQAIAQAYGKFVPVQDSPRLPPETAETFVSAFGALVGAENETLSAQVEQLTAQMQAFGAAANAVLDPAAASASSTSRVSEGGAQVAQLSEQAQALETAAANPDVNESASAGTSVDVASEVSAAQSQQSSLSSSQDASRGAALGASGEAESAASQPDALSLELQSYTLPTGTSAQLEASYRAAGFESVQDALDVLYARGAKALAAAQLGDVIGAQILVGEFGTDYRTFVAPLLSDESVRSTTSRLVEGLQDSPALRPQDLNVLLAQVGVVSGSLRGVQPSLMSRLSASTGLFWMGPIRLSIMIILCFFAFVPLYLLNLAFGGGNRNWQYIGVALLLLLLPIIFEGLSFMGSAIATFAGIGALEPAATLSIFQTPLARVAWAVVSAIAISFASVGLYGICVQFGLLGKQEEPSDTSVSDTQLYLTSEGPDTAIDWDEEF